MNTLIALITPTSSSTPIGTWITASLNMMRSLFAASMLDGMSVAMNHGLPGIARRNNVCRPCGAW